jgi:hypothetical protein
MTAPFLLIEAVATTETPLHIGDGRSVGVINYTRSHIPGSAIRGCIGLLLKRTSCKLKDGEHHAEGDECIYHRIIEDEDGGQANAFFRYAYPLHVGCGGVFYPTSKTVSICKNPQCNFSVDSFATPLDCPQCQGSLRSGPRYQCSKCGWLQNLPVGTFRSTMASIDRKYNAAAWMTDSEGQKHGTLHTLELIETGSQFKIQVLLKAEAQQYASPLGNMIAQGLADDGVGAAKSRGLGKMRIKNVTVTEIGRDIIERRAADLNGDKLGLRLLTPLVLEENESLRAETILEAARSAYTQAFRTGKPSLKELKLIDERSRFTTYGGWSLKANRKRRILPAIEAGSTYRLGELDEQLKLTLASLEQTFALGGFKTHGCGQVLLR